MKVVHVIGNLMHGGAEAVLYSLVTYPSDVEHHIISLGPPAHYSRLLEERGLAVTHLGATSLAGTIAVMPRLTRLVRKLKPDIVQTWMYRANVLAGLCAVAARLPVVWGIHCGAHRDLSLPSKLGVHLSGVFAGIMPARIINCSTVSAELHSAIGFDPSRVRVVANGYDVERFHPDPTEARRIRETLGIPDQSFLIGTVSRWHAQKDIPNLISALGRARARIPGSWRCLLVGRGLDAANPELGRQIGRAELENRFLLLGERSDIDRLMRTLDVLVLPSAEEAFPNVVAEAMASGVPCVVTRVGDAPIMVGESGWVVPAKDPHALAGALADARNEWACDRSAWMARQRAAQERVAANYSLDRMVVGYRDVWEQAVADRQAEFGRSGDERPA
jgi:glycosyltransferase involved in cell wall biosynthesis